MNISGPIRALIANNTAANTALQNRVFPGVFPEQYTLPALSVNIIRVDPNPTKSAPSDIDMAMVQIDCYATTYGQAQDISELVRTAIDYYRGDILIAGNIISIDAIDYEGQTDVWEEKPKEYRVSCDYTIRVMRNNIIGNYGGSIIVPPNPIFLQVFGPFVDDTAAMTAGLINGQLYIVDNGNDAIPAGTIKSVGNVSVNSLGNFLQVFGPYVDDTAALSDGRNIGDLYIVAAGNDAIPAGMIKKIGTP